MSGGQSVYSPAAPLDSTEILIGSASSWKSVGKLPEVRGDGPRIGNLANTLYLLGGVLGPAGKTHQALLLRP